MKLGIGVCSDGCDGAEGDSRDAFLSFKCLPFGSATIFFYPPEGSM